MEKLVRGAKTLETWALNKDVEVDEDIRRHIKSLKLWRVYGRGIFNIILHDLGGFKNDPALNARTSEIFTRRNK